MYIYIERERDREGQREKKNEKLNIVFIVYIVFHNGSNYYYQFIIKELRNSKNNLLI